MDLYARVVDGKIQEFPVYLIHIENRHHPLSWYVKCTVDEKPAVGEFSYARQVPSVTETGGVNIAWVVEQYTLDQLLSRLPVVEKEGAPRRGPQRPVEAPTESLINKIKELAIERAQTVLDTFAGTKGYGTPPGGPKSLESAISFKGSKVPEWVADAAYCESLRDDFWVTLFKYFDDVTATPQAKPWPNRWTDIMAIMPEMKWPVVTPAVATPAP